ncbi:MAG: SRPBCC family protein [Gammaproteobacteria bacterium]|nr:SRPBCC family protein [Gammaproteobacteria bacterium]
MSIPVKNYFAEDILKNELESLFQKMPTYIGHRLSVASLGDYFPLPQEQNGRVLVHTESGIRLFSNVCRHRQAILLKERGNLGTSMGKPNPIICPVHHWSYDTTGKMLGAPHFTAPTCLALPQYPLEEWNNLWFTTRQPRQVHENLMPVEQLFDFTGYKFGGLELHLCNYNWKSFLEVYLDDYHIDPYHIGLSSLVESKNLDLQFGASFSVQKVPLRPKIIPPSSSQVYQQWIKAMTEYGHGNLPTGEVVWLTYFPAVMIEKYPYAIIVSTLFPLGTQKTLNMIEFYYPEEIADFEPELVRYHQQAYMETCLEDDEISLTTEAGRKALWLRGEEDSGPYHHPMEDCLEHFHNWYHQNMSR